MNPYLTPRPVARSKPIWLGVFAGALFLGSPAAALAASPAPRPSASAQPSTKAPAPSPSTTKATFGIGPASASGVDGRPRFKWSSSPGGTLQDHVAVVNIGTTPLTLALYSRDADNQPDGSLGLQTQATKPIDVGSWITLEIPHAATSLTIPARSTIIVPVSLTVPRNASPGDHTGGIIVSLTAKSTSTGKQALTPNLEQRVAVPVALRISGPLNPKLTVQALSASYSQTLNPLGGGHATVTYHVVNSGNVNLGGHEVASISGLFGSTAHAKAPDIPVLLPGGSIVESVSVQGVLPEFLMSARVTITPLAASGDVDPGLIATSGSKHFWAVPWLLLGIIAVLLLGWRQLRRRRRPSAGRHGTRSGRGTRRRGSVHATPSPRKPAEVGRNGVTVASGAAHVLGRLVAAAMAIGLAIAIPATTASASSGLPYSDPYAHGYVGFCDQNGNNITQGSVYDKPFVWRAVSSVAAPAAYAGEGRKATLWAAQPRQGIDAGHWSGQALTASTDYTNANVPMVQATNRDYALSDFINAFPPQWDRLLELRIYFSAPEVGGDQGTYAVADIRVSGTRWSLVSGGKVDCNAGSAASPELALPSSNPAGLQPAEPLSPVAAEAVGAPIPASAGPVAGTATATADTRHGGGSSHAELVVTLVVVLVGLVGAGTFFWRRARGRVA